MIRCITFAFAAMILAVLFNSPTANASPSNEGNKTIQEYYDEQYERSGADELYNSLPNETRKSLEGLGIGKAQIDSDTSLTPQNVFASIWDTFKEGLKSPLKVMAGILSVILLCALADSMKLSFGDRPLAQTLGAVGALGVCLVIIAPITDFIVYMTNMIMTSAIFMGVYIPVAVGIMIASGNTVSALSYSFFMLGASEIISQLCRWLIIPLLNVFLALSIVSSISPTLKLNRIADMFSGASKWVLGIVTTIFVGLLTVENMVTSAADTATNRAAKFAINSFVPIIGGTLSDAFTTIQSCIKMLRSGVGAFSIVVIAVIFVPVFIQCLIWMGTMKLGSGMADMLYLTTITNLLNSVSKVLGVILAVIICCMVVFLVSTFVILTLGGGVAT